MADARIAISPSMSDSRSPNTSFAAAKAKRQSMNVVAGAGAGGSLPRPLQLGTGSVLSSPSPSKSPSPSHESNGLGSKAEDVTLTSTTPTKGTETSATVPGPGVENDYSIENHDEPSEIPMQSPTPLPPSPMSPSLRAMKRQPNARRQSSISYISNSNSISSPHSNSNSPIQGSFASRRESVDGFMRSPLSSSHAVSSFSMRAHGHGQRSPGLGRSNSVSAVGSIRAVKSPSAGESGQMQRSSTGSLAAATDAAKHLKERAPVTLAEKHAELLHFIAQKESKCLELRSQLAVHEAELLQLKRKWERIVNRGFEKSPTMSSAYTPSTPSSSASPSIPSATTPNGSSTQPYFPLLSPMSGTGNNHGPMLEGIKEGVQGVSRFIAAGLETIAGGPVAVPSGKQERATSNTTAARAKGPMPLKLGMVRSEGLEGGAGKEKKAARNMNGHGHVLGHEQKESQSSSSTNASTSTFGSNASGTTSTSLGSSISASFLSTTADGKSASEGSTPHASASASDADAEESEFGDFEDGHGKSTSVDLGSSTDGEGDQVLIVHDTGATPTMSPNPAFEKRRRKVKAAGQKHPGPAGPATKVQSQSQEKVEENNDFEGFDSWDDGWDEPTITTAADTTRVSSTSNPKAAKSKSPPIPSSLPPISSIPGLATIGMMQTAGPVAQQQMNSWVGSVNKKWGEIKGSNTFTKNQKRASVLLTDMQNTLISTLISPTPLAPSGSTPNQPNSSSLSFPSPYTSPSQRQPSPSASTSTSLLDDSDGEESSGVLASAGGDDTVKMAMSTPVLVPVSATSVSARRKSLGKEKQQVKKEENEEDEWNW